MNEDCTIRSNLLEYVLPVELFMMLLTRLTFPAELLSPGTVNGVSQVTLS